MFTCDALQFESLVNLLGSAGRGGGRKIGAVTGTCIVVSYVIRVSKASLLCSGCKGTKQ